MTVHKYLKSRQITDHIGGELQKEEELSVICVGSVFKSWKLLEKAFLEKLGIISKRINIRYLTQSSAIGAAYFAAKSHGVKLPIDFSKNYHELCCYQNGKILQWWRRCWNVFYRTKTFLFFYFHIYTWPGLINLITNVQDKWLALLNWL